MTDSNGHTVAVVVPTMNRPLMLARCLSSVSRGEHRPAQIVVCDQSAGPATRSLVEDLHFSGTEIIYVHLHRPGTSAARNAGMRAARTELVAYIDDDCAASPRWLGALVDAYGAASQREPVSAVTGPVLPMRSRAGNIPLSSRSSRDHRIFRASEGGLDRGEWAPWDAGTGGNMLASRRTLVSLGGFDEGLGPGTRTRAAEDIDLLYRLARAGTIIYEPEAVVYHPTASLRKHLTSRYAYGLGMGSMLARHLRRGEPAARSLLSLYLRHQGAEAFRRLPWSLLESVLSLAGAVVPLAQGKGKSTNTRSHPKL